MMDAKKSRFSVDAERRQGEELFTQMIIARDPGDGERYE